jgi:hypothetical protein
VTAGARGELAGRVRAIWAAALGRERVPEHTHFMALGGMSSSAMEIVRRVREELGRDIGHRDVFAAEGLADFVRRVDMAGPFEGERLEPIRRATRRGEHRGESDG